jgi:cytochrome c peroxidase
VGHIAALCVVRDRPPQSAPTVQRLSFHTCGSWSQSAQNGGCSGAWLAYPEELAFSENRGIEGVIAWLKDLQKAKFNCITLADLFTFAGVVAQEAVGGPPTAWYPGRLDALAPGPKTVPFSARLPDGMLQPQGIAYNFLNYGMTVREITALIGGGHTFGGADPTTTGWDGSFTAAGDAWPPKGQDNLYFKTLLDLEWTPYVVNETKRVQLVPAPGQKTDYAANNGKMVFRLPSDYALRAAPTFRYWSRKFADNNTLFVQDYQRIYQRTLQLGAGITWTPRTTFKWRGLKNDFEGYGPLIDPLLDPADFSDAGAGVLPSTTTASGA